jgi:alanine racemase
MSDKFTDELSFKAYRMDVKQTLGEPRLLISRAAILHNVRVLRKFLLPEVKICAIVKADAYGIGAKVVADTLANFSIDDSERPAVDTFAVATIDEAADLPTSELPILILRPIENVYLGRQRASIEYAVRSGWTLTIDTPSAVDDVARIAVACNRRGLINVMIDTGMARGGVSLEGFPFLVERIEAHPSLKLMSVGTHFSSSEVSPDPLTRQQLMKFIAVTEDLNHALGRPIRRHAANTGGIFFTPESQLDMVRPGIGIYGIDPSLKPSIQRPLRPVLKWTAPIIGIKTIAPGTSVGYNETWIARRPTRIGLLPIGYADGYLRDFSNRASVMLHNRPCPVIGKVSMDLTTIDLTDLPQASMGDEAIVLDNDPLSPASIYRLASIAQTIPYEIITSIGARVRRVSADMNEDPRPSNFDDAGLVN